MNRGSARNRRGRESEAPPFNEAPIHESGKSCQPSSASRSPHAFNEAPIHESGKCGQD